MVDQWSPAFSLSLFQILCVLPGPFYPCACVEGEKDFMSRISYIQISELDMKELLRTLFQDFCLLLKPFNQWCTFMWNIKPWCLNSYPEEPVYRNGPHCLLSTKTDGTLYIYIYIILEWYGPILYGRYSSSSSPLDLLDWLKRKKEKPLHLLIHCNACPGVLKKTMYFSVFLDNQN